MSEGPVFHDPFQHSHRNDGSDHRQASQDYPADRQSMDERAQTNDPSQSFPRDEDNRTAFTGQSDLHDTEQGHHRYSTYARDYPQNNERPYAPASPRPHSFNQVAPFDSDAADARWKSRANSKQWYRRRSAAERDDRSYFDDSYGVDRSQYDRPYDEDYYDGNERSRRRSSDDRYDDDDRHQRYESRRRDSYYEPNLSSRSTSRRRQRSPIDERIQRYPVGSRKLGGKDVFGSEDSSSLAATLAGAGGGALIGHELTKGALGPIGGAIAGGILAKFAERKYNDKRGSERPREEVLLRHDRKRSQSARRAVYDDVYDDRGNADMDWRRRDSAYGAWR